MPDDKPADMKIDIEITDQPKEVTLSLWILDVIAKEIQDDKIRPESLYHKGHFLQGHGKGKAR